jgi:hypothetical protein
MGANMELTILTRYWKDEASGIVGLKKTTVTALWAGEKNGYPIFSVSPDDCKNFVPFKFWVGMGEQEQSENWSVDTQAPQSIAILCDKDLDVSVCGDNAQIYNHEKELMSTYGDFALRISEIMLNPDGSMELRG